MEKLLTPDEALRLRHKVRDGYIEGLYKTGTPYGEAIRIYNEKFGDIETQIDNKATKP